jgi:hypothetical protein
MPMSRKCRKNEKKMTINAIQHDDMMYSTLLLKKKSVDLLRATVKGDKIN